MKGQMARTRAMRILRVISSVPRSAGSSDPVLVPHTPTSGGAAVLITDQPVLRLRSRVRAIDALAGRCAVPSV